MMKRFLITALCFVVLGPVAVLFFIKKFCELMQDALDWMVVGRAWAGWFIKQSKRIEDYFYPNGRGGWNV